jgi:putative tryptophan/tyrosine transport system substrate-binding protein
MKEISQGLSGHEHRTDAADVPVVGFRRSRLPVYWRFPRGSSLAAFFHSLEELGWREGRNLRLEYRWAAANPDQIRSSASELANWNPDAILAATTPVVRALLAVTRSIPIVFLSVSDPVGDGFVQSLSRPGGNATGFTNLERSLAGKWLELVKELAPFIRRVAALYNPPTAAGKGS